MPEPSGGQPFPKHFDGRRFFNPEGPQARGMREALRWKLSTRPEPSARFVADVRQFIPPRLAENGELLVTLVNHSTVLLQRDGVNILTDPIWSERASPLSWIGPRRRRAPGVRMEDLPEIHIVLISHNHYDHLDLPTLRRLAVRGNSTFVAPMGVGELLRSEMIGPVCELDWGEEAMFGKGTTPVNCVPAAHFSARGLFDRNKTLWCGYVIGGVGGNVYFAGDTAFGSHFKQIRQVYGAPRLALLPIGAYEPRWFMSPVHMAPGEAVGAHGILSAATSIAIHHGTFQLADEGIDTPKREILKSPPASFLILANGESARIA